MCVTLNHWVWQVQELTKALEYSQDVLTPKGMKYDIVVLNHHTSIIVVIAPNYVNCIFFISLANKIIQEVGFLTSLPSALKPQARIKVFLLNKVDYGILITLLGAIDTPLKSHCCFILQTRPTVHLFFLNVLTLQFGFSAVPS